MKTVVKYVVKVSRNATAKELQSLLNTGFRIKHQNNSFYAHKKLVNPLMIDIKEHDSFLKHLKDVGVVEDFHFDVLG